jgi:sarcosine oxidase / L-pipecolate oxidase
MLCWVSTFSCTRYLAHDIATARESIVRLWRLLIAPATARMGSDDVDRSEILIVGAGIFGTSTAYHLASTHPNPSAITVLDRAPCPSPKAASSDINKIVRADYSSQFYMELAYEAMDAWSTWPILKPFCHRTGWIALDEKDSDLAERIRQNFKNSGRPDESSDITLEDVKSRWDGILRGIDTTDYDKAYLNPSAGWVDASLATEAMMHEAIAKGVRHVVGEVDELVSSAKNLEGVRTKDGKLYTADKILLATGAWTPFLMSSLEDVLDIGEEQRTEKQIIAAGVCVAIFKLSPDEAEHYGKLPVLVYGARGEMMPPNRERKFKFTNANTFTNYQTLSSGHKISIPSSKDQSYAPEKLKEQSIEIIKARLPQILGNDRVPDEWRLCWDVISPDQNLLITRHPNPKLSNLYFATAGSFHSWKFLPIIGKYVVNVLKGESNGEEKDQAWKWKTSWSVRGAHEKTLPKGDLHDFE